MIADAKASLRRELLSRRSALPPAERAWRSAAIAARVAALPAFGPAGAVALYAPMGAEVDTSPLVQACADAGKRLAWPRMEGESRRMAFAACDAEDLVQGLLGVLQPPPGAPRVPYEEIGLACVPGVGFDPFLRRLGRGGGHYDATLPLLSRALRVALAFECQLVDAIPAEGHDAPVDCVVTELRVLGARRGPRPGSRLG